jgi:hypothetical protein
VKRILLDASSAILLHKAGVLDAAIEAHDVWMSRAVYREVAHEGRPGADAVRAAVRDRRVTIAAESAGERSTAAANLGAGERDTIADYLANRECFDFIVTDDGGAARLCQTRGLPFVNALLMVRLLRWGGHLRPERSDAAWALLQSIGRYSSEILQKAEAFLPEDLAAFHSPKASSHSGSGKDSVEGTG